MIVLVTYRDGCGWKVPNTVVNGNNISHFTELDIRAHHVAVGVCSRWMELQTNHPRQRKEGHPPLAVLTS